MTHTEIAWAPLPCQTMADAVLHARRPFIPELVRAKIHTSGETWAEIAYYLDARSVIDRLNLVVPGHWEAHFDALTASALEGQRPTQVYRCRLRVLGVVFTDVGAGQDHKAAHSDALKRASVHLGIGHCVYRIQGPRMGVGAGAHELRRSRKGRPYLDDHNREWLRRRYRQWLIGEGVAEYGLPLDHGEAARAQVPAVFPDWAARRRVAAGGGNGARCERADGNGIGAVEMTVGRLAAVKDGRASSPPASPTQRAAIVEESRACGYELETIEQLARVACETMLDRLSAEQLQALGAHVKRLAAAGVEAPTLCAKLDELQTGDPATGARAFTAWLETLDAPAAA